MTIQRSDPAPACSARRERARPCVTVRPRVLGVQNTHPSRLWSPVRDGQEATWRRAARASADGRGDRPRNRARPSHLAGSARRRAFVATLEGRGGRERPRLWAIALAVVLCLAGAAARAL